MTTLVITICAALAAAAAVGAHRVVVRGYRRAIAARDPRRDWGICVYLHEGNVMALYLLGDYEALVQEVEETTSSGDHVRVEGRLGGLRGGAGREAARQKIKRYLREEGPITVISRVIDALENAGNIVYVNLFTTSFEPGRGLDRALAARERPGRGRHARLRDLPPFVYVAVTGRFRITERTDTTTTFSAPYGDPADPESAPQQVSVTCLNSQFLDEVSQTPFSARCLGRVQGWDPDNRRLVIAPVLAVFH
jgi:hypothetical protein